jgi:hypothetical protein
MLFGRDLCEPEVAIEVGSNVTALRNRLGGRQ